VAAPLRAYEYWRYQSQDARHRVFKQQIMEHSKTSAPGELHATREPQHTILVVDDEPHVVESIRDLLRLRYRVLGATRAQEGLEILKREVVDVVLTDQRMPEMTGVELLRSIRSLYPEATRLLFSGFADLSAVVEAINQGEVYRYVAKPWDPDELLRVIRAACERHDLLVERRRLIERLSATNQELELTNAKLRLTDELKTAFINVTTHELSAPVTILLWISDLLSREIGQLPPPAGHLAQRMNHAARRLSNVVEELMTMVVKQRFELPAERRPVDVAPFLRAAADDVQPIVEVRGQKLVLDLPDNLGSLPLDRSRLRDAVNHLLLNAIKFTPDGGQLELAARRVDGTVTIDVCDRGAGIQPTDLPLLFEPFFTFDFGARGLGLGLSIVKASVEAHGGQVTVAHRFGGGSVFTITLPAESSRASP
jgi:signal transduction histidine kinase